MNHRKNRITSTGITQDVTIIMAVASMKLFNDLLNIFVYFCVVEDIASPIFCKKFLLIAKKISFNIVHTLDLKNYTRYNIHDKKRGRRCVR